MELIVKPGLVPRSIQSASVLAVEVSPYATRNSSATDSAVTSNTTTLAPVASVVATSVNIFLAAGVPYVSGLPMPVPMVSQSHFVTTMLMPAALAASNAPECFWMLLDECHSGEVQSQ
jgi:hypothetical protein